MALSTRNDDSGSNAFTLARILVPTGEMPIEERFAAIHELTQNIRAGSDSANMNTIAGLGAAVPTTVLTRLARAQSQTVDFATSNVRGAGIPLYLAGARLIGNYPVGPLAGVAFNLTLLSHDGNLDMGLHIDSAAIEQPELLRQCMEESFAKILAKAPQPEPEPVFQAPVIQQASEVVVDSEPAGQTAQEKAGATRRWWRRQPRASR